MEADFQRDYGMDLGEEIPRMSWRRFLVLCRNLSPFGAAAVRIRALQEEPENEKDAKRAADAFFTSVVSI